MKRVVRIRGGKVNRQKVCSSLSAYIWAKQRGLKNQQNSFANALKAEIHLNKKATPFCQSTNVRFRNSNLDLFSVALKLLFRGLFLVDDKYYCNMSP